MQILRDKLTKKSLIVPLLFLIIAINPITEALDSKYEALYMAMHYVLYTGGFILGYVGFRGSKVYLIPGIVIPVFWHIPYFYNLGGAYLSVRIIEDISLYLGGLVMGSTIHGLNNATKTILFVLWMMGDSVLSVLLIAGWPPYSNQVYPFSPFSVEDGFWTGIVMFVIMTVIFVYIIIGFIRTMFKI